MSTTPIHHSSSSPESSNSNDNDSPTPYAIPAEIRIFQQENGLENINSGTINYQMPTPNSKKSFCIDALLAKTSNKRDENCENQFESRTHNQFINNNYKDNVISRDLNNSPDDDNLSR